MLGLQRARDGIEDEVAALVVARQAADSEAAAARGRVAGLEEACLAHTAEIETLAAHLTAARHSKVLHVRRLREDCSPSRGCV